MLGTIFKNQRKISEIAIFKKCVQKLTKAKFQVFGVLSNYQTSMKSSALKFDKSCTVETFFLKKNDFCISDPKICDVKDFFPKKH